ncbi:MULTISPECIES: ribosome silencing factor [Ralstonia solanacearum species complex]|uniref:Ribosomal silencing factor RsfS n=2 Tax=Ralstonia solanacearum species complex TaxID=3116862 RepID=A0A0S4WDG7_RALSL|nr:ribosome silencing factor [Ralstonia pseudosolanacearum]AXW14604.1 ribosome silencing factor RsfS [Ralstonia solanacearum]ASL74456.1 ribosome silencing factor [Ralstonia pseudosolanacearum]AST27732.1 ribosome silencing factor RsfS [Ralstonia pseudosolanacearum]AXW37938.1 ribosome silencing factor RsfS [Ralstonia solanacearum]AXW70784.1 ribosome silencing factor RsfS [Ralstonia solanacearum]
MDIRKLQRVIVDALEDVKAQDIKVFNTTHLTELFDRTVIASGTSNRQTKALAASVRDAVKEAGGHVIAVEGEDVGEWVLVDCGDAVVHIMQPQLRQYYNLEEIWGDKPVRIQLGGTSGRGLPKASEGYDDEEDEAEEVTPAKRRTTKPKLAGERPTKAAAPAKTAAKKTTSRPATKRASGTSKPATKTAAKTAAKRAPAKRAS